MEIGNFLPANQERLLGYLHRLQRTPPNVLLLEGGCEKDRTALGSYWAALLNCREEKPPCLSCSTCRQIQAGVFRDVYFFDGSQDSVKIDEVRQIRRMMGEKPEYGGPRCFVFNEAQGLTVSAANSLLKSLEEPFPGNVFVLLVPLRSRLLPTLVSRSMVLSLAWRKKAAAEEDTVLKWEGLLLEFWRTGQGLFEHTGRKKELDRNMVRSVVLRCQRTLLQAVSGKAEDPAQQFWQENFQRASFGRVDGLLDKALEILNYQTNPVIVLEWLAVKIWVWIRE
ncbi:MAG: DNA polymerase III subunit delta' [Desulfohalobiaceae bacterium]|nr:DNA polymerase III subunit delta' [Desulfohalobiaceae bacterium]